MNLFIDPLKLSGLNAIVARANAIDGAEQTTAEDYLTARIDEILVSYDRSELEQTMKENETFFITAARLPSEVQQQLRDLITNAAVSLQNDTE
jgi:hypothetical protein